MFASDVVMVSMTLLRSYGVWDGTRPAEGEFAMRHFAMLSRPEKASARPRRRVRYGHNSGQIAAARQVKSSVKALRDSALRARLALPAR